MAKISKRRSRLLALSTLVAVVLGAAIWCEFNLQSATRSFDCPSSGKIVPADRFASLVENLAGQKEQRASWAYAALAGLVAISVTKQKVLPIPWLRSAYILVGASSVFLLESLHAADLFDRRVAFLVLRGGVVDSDIMGLSAVLMQQLAFLYTAMLALGLFVLSFVGAIVAGVITSREMGDQ